MANAGRRGRPIVPLVLTAEERAYLERQVSRHRVARSLSERCRVILRCADALSGKSVAADVTHHASRCELPLKFHPSAVRASTNVTPFGAVSVPA